MAMSRAAPSSIPTLTEKLLEEIFLRLPTPAALARAATACTSFRRIITDRSFLRRFRARHPPPLLGIFEERVFVPAGAPHPSAPLARALTGAADLFFSFVPAPDEGKSAYWSPSDVRDGRVLLESEPYEHPSGSVFSNLAVCDPVFRRYVLLPPIPYDLVAIKEGRLLMFVPLLAPTSEDEEDETSFKVICKAHYETKLLAFVFSSVSGEWCVAASRSWRSLRTDQVDWCVGLAYFNCARGCFYWIKKGGNRALVLDTRSMKFSIVRYNRPPRALVGIKGWCGSPHCVAVDREGALEVFSFVDDRKFKNQQNSDDSSDEDSSDESLPENAIRLPRQYEFSIVGATEGFVFLRGIKDYWDPSFKNWQGCHGYYFSLEAKTSELKVIGRIQISDPYECVHVHSYFGFPPSLSKPSI